MKKLIFAASAISLCFLISCNSNKESGGMSEKAKKNIDAFNTVDSAFQTGNLSHIDDVVAPDFVDHSGMHGEGNRDSLKAMITMMSMDKTAKSETKLQLANDDYVGGWLHFTGTSNGSMGPQGASYDMNFFELVKFKDGKASEHWAFMSTGDMMKMMPPPPMENMKDTAKNKMMEKKK